MKLKHILSALLYAMPVLLISCEKIPEVISVNNFSMVQDSARQKIGVRKLKTPDIKGEWLGLAHKIRIDTTNGTNGLEFYSVELIDTGDDKSSGSKYYDVDFLSVNRKPFIEVINWENADSHGIGLPASTYLKIVKLTADTMIVQVMKSEFTERWLKANGFKFFVLADDKTSKDHTVYLIEEPARLAKMLRLIYDQPKFFKPPDTLIHTSKEPLKHYVSWPSQ